MPDLKVDRLSLKAGQMSESDGRRLVSLIADRLAGTEFAGAEMNLSRLQLKVTTGPGTSLPAIADQIVTDLLGQLARNS